MDGHLFRLCRCLYYNFVETEDFIDIGFQQKEQNVGFVSDEL